MSKKRCLRNNESVPKIKMIVGSSCVAVVVCCTNLGHMMSCLQLAKHIVKSRHFNMSIISLMKERKYLTPYAVNLLHCMLQSLQKNVNLFLFIMATLTEVFCSKHFSVHN